MHSLVNLNFNFISENENLSIQKVAYELHVKPDQSYEIIHKVAYNILYLTGFVSRGVCMCVNFF